MEPENLQRLRDEVELKLPEIISRSNIMQVLQDSSISEGTSFEVRISKDNQFIAQRCGLKFANCPCGQHPSGNCFHQIDCNTKQAICN